MTKREAYEIWRNNTIISRDFNYCTHARSGDGPGYHGFGECEILPNVRYGRDFCPSSCKYFEFKESTVSMQAFEHLLRFSPECLMKNFNIDVNNIEEIKKEKELQHKREEYKFNEFVKLRDYFEQRKESEHESVHSRNS